MSLSLNRLLGERPESPGRVRRVLLWAAVAGGLLLLLVFQSMLTAAGQPATFGLRATADLLAIGSFAVLAVLLSRIVSTEARHPSRALWLPLLVGLLGVVASAAVVYVMGGPAQLGPTTGVPADFRSALQIVLLTGIEMSVALVVLFSLQALVLFKRTESSARNWRALLWVMVAAAAVLIGRNPVEDIERFWPHLALLILAMPMMVLHAFRLAWIVYLPFKQKLAAVGLTLSLIILLILLVATRETAGWIAPLGTDGAVGGPGDVLLSAALSVPVSRFATLVFSFGILYGFTALLAVLFHLPTARALEQKSGEMEALQALARLSTDVFDRKRLITTIASAPVESGVAEASWLALIEPERGSLRPHIAATEGLSPLQVRAMTDSEQLAADVAERGRPLVLSHAPTDHRVHARPGDGIGSLVVLPLRVHDQTLGVLFAARAMAQGFERDDVAALETFASQAALAISSARLFSKHVEHERIARELAIAREVQQRLLPDRLPCNDRLSCSAISLPAYEIAGDYYDVLELPGGRIGLIVADVAGKGTAAAFHMAELKGVFQSLGRQAASPAELLARTNEALAQSLQRGAFISAVYAILDQESGRLSLARAGHCPAILVDEDGRTDLLRPAGIGIGLDRGDIFARSLEEEHRDLRPGDTLLLYTDGIVEARAPEGGEFGYDGLIESVQRHASLSPDDLRDAIVDDVRDFSRTPSDEDNFDDDLTLLILRWSGPASATLEPALPNLAESSPIPA